MTAAPALDRLGVPEPGRPVALSPLVVRATAPNPGVMTGPGTNTYVVGTDEIAVVDPGPDEASHIDALVALGVGRIRWIVVTHTHPDHAPGVGPLARRTGAEVLGFSAQDGFEPSQGVGDGFELRGPDFTLRAVHTPGHASNHLCWLLVEEAMLFSGDHVMQGSTVVIAPPDGDMAVYLASLSRLFEIDPPLDAIAPGHGSLLDEPHATVQAIIDHRLARERLVSDVLQGVRRATVDELVPSVYADVQEALYPVARYSLWAHLRKLGDEGRARGDDPADIETTWRTTA